MTWTATEPISEPDFSVDSIRFLLTECIHGGAKFLPQGSTVEYSIVKGRGRKSRITTTTINKNNLYVASPDEKINFLNKKCAPNDKERIYAKYKPQQVR